MAWDFDNDGVVDSEQQNPEYTYMDKGLYSVSLRVSNACGTSSKIETYYITVNGVGVEMNKSKLFTCYPNPVSNELYVLFNKSVTTVFILDIQGQIVYESQGQLFVNQSYRIDVANLPQGVYFIKADSQIERIVVE